LENVTDHEEIIERVAALDIGKAELVCCVRVPAVGRRGRAQEVKTYQTMTRSLQAMVDYLVSPGADAVTAQALNVCGGLGNY